MPSVQTGIVRAEQLLATSGALARKQLFSAPLISAVHLRADEPRPWLPRPAGSRPWLMSYGGSTEGQPEASALRKLLVAKCREYGPNVCRLVTKYRMDESSTLLEAFHSKRQSTFCLEPPGFGEHRKSQVDALNLGCIPVIFTPACDEMIWPLHWGPFRHESRVLLDIKDVLAGKVDVLAALRAISPERVAQMQQAIGRYGERMHYALEDTPGDALEVLLQHLDESATHPSAEIQHELERVRHITRCADAWPSAVELHHHMLHRALQEHERWRHAPSSCAGLMAAEWGGCDGAVPSRKGGVMVRHLCLKTCGMCPPMPAS